MSTVDFQRPFDRRLPRPMMSVQLSRTIADVHPSAWWTMFLCSLAALAASVYLAWSSFTSSPVAGCGGGSVFDCSHVLHSRWSTILSIPVSVPAIVTHAIILGALLLRSNSKRIDQLRWATIGLAILAAGSAAIWFIGLQVIALGHLCPYCLVAHTAALLSASVFLWTRRVNQPSLKWIGATAVGALAALASLQLLAKPPEQFEVIHHTQSPASLAAPKTDIDQNGSTMFAPPDSANLQSSFGEPLKVWQAEQLPQIAAVLLNPAALLLGEVSIGRQQEPNTARVLNGIELSTNDWPLVGRPDAELVFVEMFDYTCPHCQRTHQSLDAARQQFGDRLAIITLPVPLDRKCNPTVKSTHLSHRESCEIAKLAVAVWSVDRSKFAGFHDYLFESKPNYATAAAMASSMVDKHELERVMRGPIPSDYIKKHVLLYQKAGSGAIPKLLFPTTTTVGAVESAESMSQLIRKNL